MPRRDPGGMADEESIDGEQSHPDDVPLICPYRYFMMCICIYKYYIYIYDCINLIVHDGYRQPIFRPVR